MEEGARIPGVQYDAVSKHLLLLNAQPNAPQHHELLRFAHLRRPSYVLGPSDSLLESADRNSLIWWLE